MTSPGMTAPVFRHGERQPSARKPKTRHRSAAHPSEDQSDCLPNHIDGMCEALRERVVSIRTGEDVRHVIVEDGACAGLITDGRGELRCRAAILRRAAGADWMGDMAKKYGMELQQRGIEVGVGNDDVMSISPMSFTIPPFLCRRSVTTTRRARSCTNPAGFITPLRTIRISCAGTGTPTATAQVGQYELRVPVQGDPDRSQTDSHGHGVAIGRPASLIGGGKPILQRLGTCGAGGVQHGSASITATSSPP